LLFIASLAQGSLLRWRREGFKLTSQDDEQVRAVQRLVSRWETIPFAFNLLMAAAVFASVVLAEGLTLQVAEGWGGAVLGATLNLIGVLSILAFARWLYTSRGLALAPRFANVAYVLAGITRPLYLIIQPWRRQVADYMSEGGDSQNKPLEIPVIDPEAELDEHEHRMIRAILRLEKTTAREIMVPRPDMAAIPTGTPLPEVVSMMIKGGFTRVPLYEEDLDHIVGLIYTRDLLGLLAEGKQEVDLKAIARPVRFVPDIKRVDDLLREFQDERIHVAIVVDEYGSTSGLLTLEDLVEEIVGDIEDEFRAEEPPVEWLSPEEAIMDAGLPLEELDRLFSVRIQGDGYDTIGGHVNHRLGKIPIAGDVLEDEEINIQVVSTLHRRIKRVKVGRRTPTTLENPDADEETP